MRLLTWICDSRCVFLPIFFAFFRVAVASLLCVPVGFAIIILSCVVLVVASLSFPMRLIADHDPLTSKSERAEGLPWTISLLTSGGSTLGRGGHRPFQIVARPPNLAELLTQGGQLILRKISNFDATRCQILRLKCTKFYFRWGSAPDPAGGAYSAPSDPLAVFKGVYF